MIARVQSFLLQGIDAFPCEVEVDLDATVFKEETRPLVVGLPDAAVKESLERVRAALANSGFFFPQGRALINLAPADVRKEGPVYDLPIAVGLLLVGGVLREGGGPRVSAPPAAAAAGAKAVAGTKGAAASAGARPLTDLKQFDLSKLDPEKIDALFKGDPDAEAVAAKKQRDVEAARAAAEAARAQEPGIDPREYLFAGEVALDGRLRPIKGVIALASMAKQRGYTGVVVPAENAPEAAVVPGLEVLGARTLAEVVGLITGAIEPRPEPAPDVSGLLRTAPAPVDFLEVRGQEAVKRALVIAAAGGHNILLLGPPGTGKTMMAKALPGILPPLSPEEALEVTRVYSAAGELPGGQGLVTQRPVRSPHHTASTASIVGGGMVPRPGEISLAHHGVLFLDELPEFPRFVLDAMRQPLEDHVVTITRAHGAVKFPASFMLVAAMNPTPRGDRPTDEVGRRAMENYLSRLSGPFLDRIDLHCEAPAVPWKELSRAPTGTGSAQMREQVLRARETQRSRQGALTPNARLSGKQLDAVAPLEEQAKVLLGQAMTEMGLSARAYDKIRRVARTIADIAGEERVGVAHVAEAVQYRLLDRRV